MPKDPRFDRIQADIARSITDAQLDLRKRKDKLLKLQKLGSPSLRVAVFYTSRDRALSQYDTLPFANMLKSIGTVANLDLIVVCPGGDGTAAETMLDLCRKHCTGSLRVSMSRK